MLYFSYVSYIVSARQLKFILCPATIRSENIGVQAQGDLSHTQSQDDEEARRDPLSPEMRWRKVWLEKNSHSLPERPKLRNARGPELLGLYARDARAKPYLEQQNFEELKTTMHIVLIETCESGNNHQNAIVEQHLEAWRSMLKQKIQGRHGIISWNLAKNFEVNHRIITESHRHITVQKDLGLLK